MDFFKALFKAFKFATSATVGIPIACSASAFIGSLYLMAEATNIVETNVKHSVDGSKKVYQKPFYQAIADGLGMAFGKTWSEFGAYAPLTVMKGISEAAGRSSKPRDLVEATLEKIVNDESFTKENPLLAKDLQSNLEQMKKHTPKEAEEFAKNSRTQAIELPQLMDEKLGADKVKDIYNQLDKDIKELAPAPLNGKANSASALESRANDKTVTV